MKFKILTVSFADNIINKLQKYCEKTGQKQTDVIRQAVYEFLINFTIDGEELYKITDV